MTREARIKLQKEYIILTADRTDITQERKAEIIVSAIEILERIWKEQGNEPWYDTEEEKKFKEWYQKQIGSY
jgi:hypothetical protein